ncbi:hypothetical protein [Paenibacillus sp. LHD-38]|uniref:hypothetical protein n=1 Tax=Paenibacillus sp. LHD-38 TaxID=3072143 RepID=UPI0035BEA09B
MSKIVPNDEPIRLSTTAGVGKINVNIENQAALYNPRKYMTPARIAMKAVICYPRIIRLFGSNNQA